MKRDFQHSSQELPAHIPLLGISFPQESLSARPVPPLATDPAPNMSENCAKTNQRLY